jgi:hypothetical protein
LWGRRFGGLSGASAATPEAKEKHQAAMTAASWKWCFSLSSEATAEGKFGRAAGNIGIRCRQPWLVAANHQASWLVQWIEWATGSQSVNTRVIFVERQRPVVIRR